MEHREAEGDEVRLTTTTDPLRLADEPSDVLETASVPQKKPPTFLSIAGVTSVATVCRVADSLVSVAVLGHVSVAAMDGASLGAAIVQIVFTPFQGFSVSLNTLISQAVGAGSRVGGRWLHIAVCFILLSSLMMAGLLFAASSTLPQLLSSDDEVVSNAKDYLLVSTVKVGPTLMYQGLRQYLQAQGITRPELIISIVGLLVSIGLHVLFVIQLGWGSAGSAAATAVVFILQVIVILSYIFLRRAHLAWCSWAPANIIRSLTRRRIKTYLLFAGSVSIMSITEEWVFSGLLLVSATLGENNLSAMTILVRTFDICWGLFWGVGLATQVRIGNQTGAGDIPGAKATVKKAVGIGGGVLLFNVLVLTLFRHYVVAVFTNDEAVQDAVAHALPWFLSQHVLSSLVLLAVVTLMGAGQPGRVTVASTLIAWLVSVPTAVCLAFKAHQGVTGVWRGLLAGEVMRSFVVGLIGRGFDWERAVRIARERMAEGPTVIDDPDVEDGDEGGDGGKALLPKQQPQTTVQVELTSLGPGGGEPAASSRLRQQPESEWMSLPQDDDDDDGDGVERNRD